MHRVMLPVMEAYDRALRVMEELPRPGSEQHIGVWYNSVMDIKRERMNLVVQRLLEVRNSVRGYESRPMVQCANITYGLIGATMEMYKDGHITGWCCIGSFRDRMSFQLEEDAVLFRTLVEIHTGDPR